MKDSHTHLKLKAGLGVDLRGRAVTVQAADQGEATSVAETGHRSGCANGGVAVDEEAQLF